MEPNDERINVPGVQSTDNWTYRMKVSIEALLAYDVFNDHLRELVVRRRERVPAAIADAARQ
jgi:4-alpha-glucanotransferase